MGVVTCWSDIPDILCFIIANGSDADAVYRLRQIVNISNNDNTLVNVHWHPIPMMVLV